MSHFAGWRKAVGAERTRHEAGRMNKLEAAYAQHLDLLRLAGDIQHYDFEALKLRLADRSWYTADFLVQMPLGWLVCDEVKGFWEDDARRAWKSAAERFPLFIFRAVTRKEGIFVFEYAFPEDAQFFDSNGAQRREGAD